MESYTEFRQFTRVVETLRPYVIDYIVLNAEAKAVAAVEVAMATEFDDLLEQTIPSVSRTMETQARAQRAVANYLANASALRDRFCVRLTRKFGKGSSEIQTFNARLSHHFDTSFAYRVTSVLRNHSQHHENPLSLVQMRANRDQAGKMKTAVGMQLHFAPLIANKKLNAKVRAELAALSDPDCHLTPIIAENMAQHSDLFALVIDFHKNEIVEMAQYALALYRHLGVPQGAYPVIFEGPDPALEPNEQQRWIFCGFDELEKLVMLHKEIRGGSSF